MKNIIVIVLSIFLFSAAANAQVTRFFDTWTSQESNKDLNINPTGTGKMVVNGTPAKMCPEYTSTGRNAFTTDGGCVYNINSFQYEYYDGNAAIWKPFGTGSGSGGLALWATATSYFINDFVVESDKIYRAIANHLSTIFASDLANWTEVSPVTQQLTIGTIDSQVKSADGASINANAFYLQTADSTFPGLVSTGTQTFAGDKSVSGNLNSQTLAVSGNVNFVSLSGSLPVQTDASKNLVSMAIDLASSQASGIVPITKGGTGSNLSGASASSLVYKNSLTTYDEIPNWIVQTEGGLSAVNSLTPANPVGPTAYNLWNYQHNVTPTQDAPNLSYTFQSNRMDIAGDYTMDTNIINAATLNQSGSSNTNQMILYGAYSAIGNGTDHANTNYVSAYYGNTGISASSSANQLKGMDLNLYTQSNTSVNDITGSNININIDGPVNSTAILYNAGFNATASSPVNSFTGMNLNPVFYAPVTGTVAGINFNPQVRKGAGGGINLFYSNPYVEEPINGLTGYFVGGNGSGPVNNYIGFLANPSFASPGQYATGLSVSLPVDATIDLKGADIQVSGSAPNGYGANINLTGTYTTAAKGLNINVDNATLTGGRVQSLSANGGVAGINSSVSLINNGTFDAATQLVSLGAVASGNPVSTDFIALSSPMLLTIHDNMTPGALNIGASSVGYVSQIIADAGVTANTVSMATAGFVDGGGTGGTITNASNFRSLGGIFTGGALAVDNLYHFKAEQSGFGTNIWGVYVADTNAENYFDKSIAIGTTTKKVANSDVALEIKDGKVINLPKSSSGQIAGYTALEGMFGYDDTQNFPTFYNGSSWVLMDGSGGGGGSTTVLPGALDSQAKTANGFYASGNTVAMQSADATFPGIVTTGAQTFAGDKSFTGNLNAQTLVVSGNVNLVGLSVSLPVQTDASNNLISQAIDLSTTQAVGVNTLAKGGTNKNITASNGAFVYSDADSFELSGIGSAGQPVLSGGAGAPSYFTGTGLVTAASGNLNAAYGAANTVAGMDSAGTAIEYKAVTGTTSQVVVSHSANSITISLPQNVDPSANFVSNSLRATGLNNGRVALVGAGGAITDDADFTYTSDTLIGTKGTFASTSITNDAVGNSVILPTTVSDNLKLKSSSANVVYQEGSDAAKKVGSRNPELLELLKYPSFEESVTEGTCTNCTSTQSTTTGSMFGTKHLDMVFGASSTGNYTVDKTTGFDNAVPAIASCYIKTTRAGVRLYARNGAADGAYIDVSDAGVWNKYEVPFSCGTTSCGYKINASTSTTTTISVNECHVTVGQKPLTVGAISGWQDYGSASSFTGIGTPTVTKLQWRQVGENVEVSAKFTTGTATAVEFKLDLPNGYTVDSAKIGTNIVAGQMQRTSQSGIDYSVVATGLDAYVGVARGTNTGSAFVRENGSTAFGNTEISQITFSIPVSQLRSTVAVSGMLGPSQIKWSNVTNCNGSTTSATFADLVDTDCTYASASKIGTTVTPTTTGALALKIPTVKAGKYSVSFAGVLGSGASTTCAFRLYDGTNIIGPAYSDSPAGTFLSNDGQTNIVEYTSDQTNLEWKLQAIRVGGSGSCQAIASDANNSLSILFAPISEFAAGSGEHPIIYLSDVKASGTDGGSSAAGTTYNRNLNTLSDPLSGGFVFNSSSFTGTGGTNTDFTLIAGTYRIRAEAPACKPNGTRIRLYNTTDSTTDIFGQAIYNNQATGCVIAPMDGIITISSNKTFQIRHYIGAAEAGDGLGGGSADGSAEVYTKVSIEKIR